MELSRTIRLALALVALAVYIPGCLSLRVTPPKPDGDVSFPSWQSAAATAKAMLQDFIAKGLVTASRSTSDSVASSRALFHMPRIPVDMQKLRNAVQATTLSQILLPDTTFVVPLEDAVQPLTIVDLEKVAGGWRIRGINDRRVTRALKELLPLVDRTKGPDITLYEVNEFFAQIYGVRDGTGAQTFYTSFGRSDGRLFAMPQDSLMLDIGNMAAWHHKQP